jgi:hypothetical protein
MFQDDKNFSAFDIIELIFRIALEQGLLIKGMNKGGDILELKIKVQIFLRSTVFHAFIVSFEFSKYDANIRENGGAVG